MAIPENEGNFCPFLGGQVEVETPNGPKTGTICTSVSEIADGVKKTTTGDKKQVRICPYVAGTILSRVSPEGCAEMHLSTDPR